MNDKLSTKPHETTRRNSNQFRVVSCGLVDNIIFASPNTFRFDLERNENFSGQHSYALLMRPLLIILFMLCAFILTSAPVSAQQKKKKAQQPRTAQTEAAAQLAKSREEYVRVTREYKASLQSLLGIYENNVRKAQAQVTNSRELYAQGLISKHALDESEARVVDAQAKVNEVKQQMATADTQIADTLIEAQTDEQMARARPVPSGSLVRTTAYIRYNAPGVWLLSEAWKVQRFFLQKFGRPLPISAFGQSAIHDQWRLDHHNAMDVPINPDGAEGQALMEFLRASGIPFSAFRMAIPGTATGPHIHIGQPSHRY